jgi:hypothetical protein
MWIHLLEAVFSCLTIFIVPFMWIAAMTGAEILLDRLLYFFHRHKHPGEAGHTQSIKFLQQKRWIYLRTAMTKAGADPLRGR